jgi:hypothetical protein
MRLGLVWVAATTMYQHLGVNIESTDKAQIFRDKYLKHKYLKHKYLEYEHLGR